MWRLMPFLVFVGVMAALAFLWVVIVPRLQAAARLRQMKAARRAELELKTAEFQHQRALEGLSRTYDRMESGQDAVYAARTEARVEAASKNPLDLDRGSIRTSLSVWSGVILIAALTVICAGIYVNGLV